MDSVLIFTIIGVLLVVLVILIAWLYFKCCRRNNKYQRNRESSIPSFTGVRVDVPYPYYDGYSQQQTNEPVRNLQNYGRAYGQPQTSESNQETKYEYMAQNHWNQNFDANQVPNVRIIRPEPKTWNLGTTDNTQPYLQSLRTDSNWPQINQWTAPTHVSVGPKITPNRKNKSQPRKVLSPRDENIEYPTTSNTRTSRKKKAKERGAKSFENQSNGLLDRHRTKLRRLPKRKIVEDSICLKSFELIDETGRIPFNITNAYLNNFQTLSDRKTDWSKVFPGVITSSGDYVGAIKLTAQLLKTMANPNEKREIISLVDQLIRLRVSELDKSSDTYHGHLHIVRNWKNFKQTISI